MNESRFKNCVMPLHKTLYAYALTILRNESDAEDCIQEAFTRLWENRGRLSEIENVAGYATVTVKNIALSMVSRSRPAFDAIDGSIPDIADSAPTPSSLTEHERRSGEIAQYVAVSPCQPTTGTDTQRRRRSLFFRDTSRHRAI